MHPRLSGLRKIVHLALLMLATASAAASQPEEPSPGAYGIGQPASAQDIARVNLTVMPDGRGLPAGAGSAGAGEIVYTRDCASCHGPGGVGGQGGALAGAPLVSPDVLAADKSQVRTVGNYWPYATTLFDYIRRAMPLNRPGSLSNEDVYAVTAYLLHLNDLTGPDWVADAQTLPAVVMPAQRFFRPDRRVAGAQE